MILFVWQFIRRRLRANENAAFGLYVCACVCVWCSSNSVPVAAARFNDVLGLRAREVSARNNICGDDPRNDSIWGALLNVLLVSMRAARLTRNHQRCAARGAQVMIDIYNSRAVRFGFYIKETDRRDHMRACAHSFLAGSRPHKRHPHSPKCLNPIRSGTREAQRARRLRGVN